MLSIKIIEKMALLLGKRTMYSYSYHLRKLTDVNRYLHDMETHFNVLQLYKLAEDDCYQMVFFNARSNLYKSLKKIRTSLSIPKYILKIKTNSNYANSRL